MGKTGEKPHEAFFTVEKRQKAVKNKVFEKIIEVGSVLVSVKKVMTNILFVVVAEIYFAGVPEEVLVKITNEKSRKWLKNDFEAFV